MDRAIRLLRDDKDKLEKEARDNQTRIKELEERNICLRGKVKEMDDALECLNPAYFERR